ncbi:hypothetical protein U0070_023718 [Myodes glareolus]|uniref:Cytochrome P450 n=1 Tax=Myodes glareolus TaxID=447135 RepID=A0AAW0H5J7_MYOGA
MYKLQNCYGDVFSLQMAWKPVVVINGLKAVREVLVTCGEDTSDRPPIPPLNTWTRRAMTVEGSNRVLSTPRCVYRLFLHHTGLSARAERRFSVSTLRNFGLGKKSLEQWVTEEAGHLCDAFSDQAGCPFNPSTFLNKAVCNVIASLIFARRFEYEDPYLIRMLKLMKKGKALRLSLWLSRFLTHFRCSCASQVATKVFERQKNFMAMVDNLRTRDPEKPPRNLTDAFLAEVEKAKGNPESSFNDENLRMVVGDLFTAGWDHLNHTVVGPAAHDPTPRCAETLSLSVVVREEQREAPGNASLRDPVPPGRVQQEIDDIIGQGRSPEMADQARMPYTNAVIHEVQRDDPPHQLVLSLKDETVWESPSASILSTSWMPRATMPQAALGSPLPAWSFSSSSPASCSALASRPSGQPRPSDHGNFAVPVAPSPYHSVL